MEFYGREEEIKTLNRIRKQSHDTATFTVMIGRRRVGKTALVTRALQDEGKVIYLFVKRTSEALLCDEFRVKIEELLGKMFWGQVTKLKDLFEYLFLRAEQENFSVIIDEFQDFEYVNPSFCSELQYLWDMHHQRAKINLVVCGSIYSMMVRMFESYKEPLFGRMTNRIHLRPFSIKTIKEILANHNPYYTVEDLLCLFAISGGVPLYISLLMDTGATSRDAMLDAVCSPGSRFLTEGRDMLIGEFGKTYSTYFGILQLIANGMTSQKEIDSIVGKNCGPYLQTLETEYSLIRRNLPIGSKPGTRNIKWQLNDNFLLFWFRFIFPNASFIETGKMNLLRESIESGYSQFCGLMLERYFRQKILEETEATTVGSWWDRKGENEIDLVAISSIKKWIRIAEIKLNRDKIDMTVLREKVSAMRKTLPRYPVELLALSMDEI